MGSNLWTTLRRFVVSIKQDFRHTYNHTFDLVLTWHWNWLLKSLCTKSSFIKSFSYNVWIYVRQLCTKSYLLLQKMHIRQHCRKSLQNIPSKYLLPYPTITVESHVPFSPSPAWPLWLHCQLCMCITRLYFQSFPHSLPLNWINLSSRRFCAPVF